MLDVLHELTAVLLQVLGCLQERVQLRIVAPLERGLRLTVDLADPALDLGRNAVESLDACVELQLLVTLSQLLRSLLPRLRRELTEFLPKLLDLGDLPLRV